MVKHSEMLISEIKNQIGELVANCNLIMQEQENMAKQEILRID